MHCYALLKAEVIGDVWERHCKDPIKQAFRTHLLLRTAHVDYDYDAKDLDYLL